MTVRSVWYLKFSLRWRCQCYSGLDMVIVYFSEMLVSAYESTQHHDPPPPKWQLTIGILSSTFVYFQSRLFSRDFQIIFKNVLLSVYKLSTLFVVTNVTLWGEECKLWIFCHYQSYFSNTVSRVILLQLEIQVTRSYKTSRNKGTFFHHTDKTWFFRDCILYWSL